jgi:putative DNA primase/helicase
MDDRAERFPVGDFSGTEEAQARWVVMLSRPALRFNPEVGWLVFDPESCRWTVDERAAVEAVRHAARLRQGALSTIEAHKLKEAARFVARITTASSIRQVASLCAADDGALLKRSEMDPAGLVNCHGLAFDYRSGEFAASRAEHYFTKSTKVRPSSLGSKPFMDLLGQALGGDHREVAALLRFFGYAATDSTVEQRAGVIVGPAGTSKTTVSEAVSFALGDYADTVPAGTLSERASEGVPNDLAKIILGPHLGVLSETDGDQFLAESLFKRLVGGEPMAARFLHREWFTATPRLKLLWVSNFLFRLRHGGNAIFRRCLVWRLDRVLTLDQMDRHLPERLRAEAGGILRILLDEAHRWHKDGLLITDRMRDELRQFEESEDRVGRFLSEACELDQYARVSTVRLYGAYKAFAEAEGGRAESRPTLLRNLAERGFARVHTNAGPAVQGITLKVGSE